MRQGDTVKILSGKDRGKRGRILRVYPELGKVLIEGMNLKKKHRRSRRQDKKGEIILLPHPISASATAVVCASCGKPTRVGYRFDENGTKHRICKRCGKDL